VCARARYGFIVQNALNNRLRLCSSVALSLVLVSCVYIPTPEHSTVSERGRVTVDSLKQLVPQQSSRADVLLLLGEPSTRENDDQYLYFSWQAIQGYLVIGFPGGGWVGDIPNSHILVVEFSDEGRLTRYEFFDSGLFGDLNQAIEKWKLED